jgi:hypothetical protein
MPNPICKTVKKKLFFSVDGDPSKRMFVSNSEEKRMNEHIASCKSCGKLKTDYIKTMSVIKTLESKIETPKGLIEDTMKKISNVKQA